jgi:hypothetical protein
MGNSTQSAPRHNRYCREESRADSHGTTTKAPAGDLPRYRLRNRNYVRDFDGAVLCDDS